MCVRANRVLSRCSTVSSYSWPGWRAWWDADLLAESEYRHEPAGLSPRASWPVSWARLQAIAAADQGLAGLCDPLCLCRTISSDDDTASRRRYSERARAALAGLMRSASNSAAHFLPNQPLFDWSRPGIMLYGASPMFGKTGPELGLEAGNDAGSAFDRHPNGATGRVRWLWRQLA